MLAIRIKVSRWSSNNILIKKCPNRFILGAGGEDYTKKAIRLDSFNWLCSSLRGCVNLSRHEMFEYVFFFSFEPSLSRHILQITDNR